MKKIAISTASFITLSLPMLVLAETANLGSGSYVDSLFSGATTLLSRVLVFLISLAVVWFIWNVIQYTISDDEEKKGKAKQQMIWGIVGLAVIVSIWGLVAILRSTFLSSGTEADHSKATFERMIPQ